MSSSDSMSLVLVRSLVAQLAAIAPAGMLVPSLRTAAVAGAVAVAAVAPGQASAQPQQRDLLSQQSASRWGAQFGGAVVGDVLREALPGRTPVERVVAGMAAEVGRNMGQRAFEAPYGGEQPRSPVAGRSYAALTTADVDQMDTLSLRAAFAYERYLQDIQGRGLSAAQARTLAAPFETSKANLQAMRRILEREGKDVRPWAPMMQALAAPVGSISLGHINSEGMKMLERLQRPGGPGFVDVPQVHTLQSLRQQMIKPPAHVEPPDSDRLQGPAGG